MSQHRAKYSVISVSAEPGKMGEVRTHVSFTHIKDQEIFLNAVKNLIDSIAVQRTIMLKECLQVPAGDGGLCHSGSQEIFCCLNKMHCFL